MDKKYLCIFKGVTGDKAGFRSAMHRLGLSDSFLDELILKAPVVVKRDVQLRDARRYADMLQDAGAIVSIRENGVFAERRPTGGNLTVVPFEAFVMCPECGFKQAGSARCQKCGHKLGGGSG
jgi:hypothetical protein